MHKTLPMPRTDDPQLIARNQTATIGIGRNQSLNQCIIESQDLLAKHRQAVIATRYDRHDQRQSFQ